MTALLDFAAANWLGPGPTRRAAPTVASPLQSVAARSRRTYVRASCDAAEKAVALVGPMQLSGEQVRDMQRAINAVLACHSSELWPEHDDLRQQALEIAVNMIQKGQFRGDADQLPALAAGITRNLVLREVRRLRSAPIQEGGPDDVEIMSSAQVEAPSHRDPGLKKNLDEAIARVSAKRRQAVIAILKEGKTNTEHAQSIGALPATVGEALSRGRDDLMQMLDEETGEFKKTGGKP